MALLFIVCLVLAYHLLFSVTSIVKMGQTVIKSCDVTLLESRLFQNVIAVIFIRPAFILRASRYFVFDSIPSDDVSHICSNNNIAFHPMLAFHFFPHSEKSVLLNSNSNFHDFQSFGRNQLLEHNTEGIINQIYIFQIPFIG